MMDRCLGAQQSRSLQRTLRHRKATIFCLVLTVVVLRGTIGVEKSRIPVQDFTEIRDHLYFGKRAKPHHVLEEVQTTSSGNHDAGANTKNDTNFDINNILPDNESESDPNKPYSLGPKITDWDEQRSKWLKEHPNTPNFTGPNKPRVLLVTGSSPEPCENPVGDHYLLKSIKNKVDYCRLHGIETFYNMASLETEMTEFWGRLVLIRKLLLSHPEVEFLWWMDSGAMFTDMTFEVPWKSYKDANLVMHNWKKLVHDQKNWIGLDTGSFLLRNWQWALDLLDAWAPMGPKGKVFTRELPYRPVFESHDRSALVYLLAAQREKWGDKVYLENAYYLHDSLGSLSDRYEEMIEKYHPSSGDHRWPLVTYFVGCKPCGKRHGFLIDNCFKQMDRAFNSAHDQILHMYEFDTRPIIPST
ncbi:hypothetical protein V6N13_071404 [Hibiscus sabdariffa]|uniref:Uncharacterized protein n=1 Tax=Hibiscus sabdariffa TaxID=183260 RepID=A0ABR2TDJ8_9ROSI